MFVLCLFILFFIYSMGVNVHPLCISLSLSLPVSLSLSLSLHRYTNKHKTVQALIGHRVLRHLLFTNFAVKRLILDNTARVIKDVFSHLFTIRVNSSKICDRHLFTLTEGWCGA